MRTFKVGDRVVVVRSLYPSRIGEVATVLAIQPGPIRWCRPDGSSIVTSDDAYDLSLAQIPGDSMPDVPVAYPASHLEHLPDDSAERGEWTDELRRLCRLGVKEEA